MPLAAAPLHNPKILILDEPANGLDPMGIIAFRQLLLKLNAANHISIIISIFTVIIVLLAGSAVFNQAEL